MSNQQPHQQQQQPQGSLPPDVPFTPEMRDLQARGKDPYSILQRKQEQNRARETAKARAERPMPSYDMFASALYRHPDTFPKSTVPTAAAAQPPPPPPPQASLPSLPSSSVAGVSYPILQQHQHHHSSGALPMPPVHPGAAGYHHIIGGIDALNGGWDLGRDPSLDHLDDFEDRRGWDSDVNYAEGLQRDTFEERERRMAVLPVLDSPDLLMMAALGEGDSIPNQRRRLTHILCGVESDEEDEDDDEEERKRKKDAKVKNKIREKAKDKGKQQEEEEDSDQDMWN